MLPHAIPSGLLAVLMAAFFGGSAGQSRECVQGYYDNGRICMPCEQGTYKSTVGPSQCIPCESDGNGRPGSTRGTAAVGRSACFFRPYVIDFHPKRGPVAGGTKLNISIGYLENRIFFRLRIARIPAEIESRGLDTIITYTGNSPDGPRNGTIMAELIDTETEYRIESSEVFTYEPNPFVTYIKDLNDGTIASGGITLEVHGEGLLVVGMPLMIITRVHKKVVKTFITPCTVVDNQVMTCKTPNLSEGLNMDDIAKAKVSTTVQDEGVPSSREDSASDNRNTQPDNAIPDTARNCTINRSNTTRILNNGTIVTEFVTTVSGPRDCRRHLSSGGNSNSRRLKRAVQEKGLQSEPLNNNDLNFYVGFQFDGLTTYNNFTSLPVYPDPEYFKFDEPDHVRHFSQKSIYLHIKGEHLTQGVHIQDIVVLIGEGYCNITKLATNRLICKPPREHPGHGRLAGPDDSVLIEVRVGYLTYFIGYLKYGTEEIEEEPTDYFLIIVTTTTVFIVWIVCMWIVCTCTCRKASRRRKRRRAKAGRLRKVISGGSSSTEAGDYLYPTDSSDNTGSTASGGFDNITVSVIPMFDIMNLLDEGLKEKVQDCQLSGGNLRLAEPIGSGTFGRVYKGHLSKEKKEMVVAVKTLRDSNANEKEVSVFLEEALVMKGFNHPNILPLYGVVVKDYLPLVVFEFMDNGDLKSYIVKNKSHKDYTTSDLLGFGLQVSNGMNYLSKEGFVHRDLAARNCLINADEVVKIGDFGLSRDLHGQDYYRIHERGRPLPVKWMAAESLNLGKFTSKTDIWSFGVLLWELLSKGLTPYDDVDNSDLKKYINQGYRLSKPDNTSDDVYKLMKKCWAKDPEMRPGFETLSQTLRDITDKYGFSNKGLHSA